MLMEGLTGKFYFKNTWKGLVLLVELEVRNVPEPYKYFRKARLDDLAYLNITMEPKPE